MNREFTVASQPLFQRVQFEFAGHIRNPLSNSAPEGIEDRRLAIYRNLFFNNIESFIANGFPILKSITDTDRWVSLVRDFVHRHQSQSILLGHLAMGQSCRQRRLRQNLASQEDRPGRHLRNP